MERRTSLDALDNMLPIDLFDPAFLDFGKGF